MPVINRISAFHKDMTAWRHDIHSHPETAFEEVRTADVVAETRRAASSDRLPPLPVQAPSRSIASLR